MKYLLLIYQNPANWDTLSQTERDGIVDEVGTIMAELTESGEWVSGEALADSSLAKTIRVRSGVPAITDGPFVEAKEQLVGFCMLECESIERAVEIGASWPDARYWGVEIRPLMSDAGAEM